jgi:hypothetical protein
MPSARIAATGRQAFTLRADITGMIGTLELVGRAAWFFADWLREER